jgi:hypothetical protein
MQRVLTGSRCNSAELRRSFCTKDRARRPGHVLRRHELGKLVSRAEQFGRARVFGVGPRVPPAGHRTDGELRYDATGFPR